MSATYSGPCPNCGAIITGDATLELRCLFCKARVLTPTEGSVRCPKCGGTTTGEDPRRHCTQCGALVVTPLRGIQTHISSSLIPRHEPSPMPSGPTAWRPPENANRPPGP